MRALGADAAGTKGWAGVVIDDHGFVAAVVAPSLAELIAQAEAAGPLDAIGVDIPIGLVDAPVRSADQACREAVGPRRSSVFAAPHPSVIHLESYGEVNAALVALGHPRLSKQAFHLFPRIREAAALAADPRIIEVFPEATFAVLAGRHLAWSKKTWNGAAERRALLAGAVPAIHLADDLGAAGGVVADDVLDAAAAAWSALRRASGLGVSLGHPTEVDARTGRPAAVWV